MSIYARRWRVDGGHRYSQLSSCRVHTCLSMGYLVRSMLQAIVAVMLLCIQRELVKKKPSKTPPARNSSSFDVGQGN